MRRVFTDRRAWAFGAAALGLALVSIWFMGVRRAPARIARIIESRLPLTAEIDDADIGLGTVTLNGVRLRDDSGTLSIQIDKVQAEASLLSALWQGARAVRSVRADTVQVSVDLGRASTEASLREFFSALTPPDSADRTSPDSAGGGRTYIVTDLVLEVRDAHGPLIRMSELQLHKEGDRVRSSVAKSLVGDADSDHARVGLVEGELVRSEGSWALESLAVEQGSVRWLETSVEGDEPLALRLRDAARLVIEARRPPNAVAVDPAPQDEAGGDPIPDRRAFLSRLSPTGSVTVSNLDVESRTPGGDVERVEDFTFALTGLGEGWFRMRTTGRTSNSGEVDVDLKLQPMQARAEGNVKIRGVSLALLAPLVPEIPLYNPEEGVVTAELALDADHTGEIHLEGVVALRNASLFSERLAPNPIESLSASVRGKGVWYPAERRLGIEEAQLRTGAARLLIQGELERTHEHYRVDLTARMPPTPCNDVVSAIPKDVFGPLAGFSWTGTWGGMGHLLIDSRDLDATELSMRVRDLCEFVRAPRWVRVERFQEPFRHSVVEPDETTFQMVTGPETENWVPFAEISPFIVEAVLSHEDARFYDHGGFAPWAIRDALVRNLKEGRYVVGASTISMQLAKNLYLKREKTIARKVQEVILTWWLENALNKDEILELYLNVIEYGPAIYGLRNGAAYYFGRTPDALSPAEAAFLACILPSPKRYHVSYERDALTRGMRGKMTRLLEHMSNRERIGPEALEYGLAEIDAFDFRQAGEPLPLARALPPLGVAVEAPDDPDPFEALFVAP
ncbi:MAG: transglycosylase domain-containing protein [Myxococcota bacterium]